LQFHFATRVWHPNVHPETGKPCVDLLREAWKPTMTVRDLLVFIRELLAAPNASE
jgi:ubiquitin-protein ligase